MAVAIAEPYLVQTALEEMEEKAKEAGVQTKDAVIAFKTGEGRIKIRQTKDMTTPRLWKPNSAPSRKQQTGSYTPL